MQYKVLALDLDGTLTNSEKIITPRTKAALMEAAARGVCIVLASGRPTVSAVSKKFKQRSNVVLPEPEDPIMASASPFCKSNEISRSTAVLPKLLPIPATSNNAIAVPP